MSSALAGVRAKRERTNPHDSICDSCQRMPTRRDSDQLTFWSGIGLFVGGWWRGLWLAALVILTLDLLVRVFG